MVNFGENSTTFNTGQEIFSISLFKYAINQILERKKTFENEIFLKEFFVLKRVAKIC